MKEKKVKDERLVQLTNRILKETYLLMAGLLVISVLVKTYGLKLPYTQSIPELIILLVSCLYVAVRSMFLGGDLVDTSKQGKRLTILAALGLSLVVAILNGARNYAAYGDQYRGAGRHLPGLPGAGFRRPLRHLLLSQKGEAADRKTAGNGGTERRDPVSCVQREGPRGGIFLEQLAGKALQELGQCAIIIVRSCNERLTDSEGEAA